MASVIRIVAMAVGAVGLGVALGSGYLVIRGPFFGGPMLAPRPLLLALGAFIVGIAVMAWGLTQYART